MQALYDVETKEFGSNKLGFRLTQLEGRFQDTQKAAHHIGLIIDATMKLEVITCLTSERWNSGKTEELISTSYQSDDVRFGVEFSFRLGRKISRRDLQAIVDGNIMPAALQAIGYYRGDSQVVPKPTPGSTRSLEGTLFEINDRLDETAATSSGRRRATH